MSNIVHENITRKVDSLGRVSIPSGLRSRYGFNAGDELSFSTMSTGIVDYVLMSKDSGVDPKYIVTADVLNELGCEIPKQLSNAIYGTEVDGQLSLEV